MNEPQDSPTDHGEVVPSPRLHLSWAWLFPVLAALAAGWLFWSNWKSNGPEIEIEFESVPGIQAGKTQLIYRGVVAGLVSRVHLDATLEKAVVGVRLKAFARGLAREGTTFWIDQPVIGLAKTSGIESLIQGNSIQARIGEGKPATHFVGSDDVPLTPLEEPSVNLHLRAMDIPFLDRGSPVYFRGVVVGAVESKVLDANKEAVLNVIIDKEYAPSVCANARFWPLPAASVKVGAGMVRMDLAGLKALVLGGVAFDYFGEPGGPVQDGAEFALCPGEAAARANGAPLQITFHDALGIRPGITELRYLGVPVGLVESLLVDKEGGRVETSVRLMDGYDNLRKEGTVFTLIRPRISIEGITGLESLIGGVYIDCAPGSGAAFAGHFVGRTIPESEEGFNGPGDKGTTVLLHADEIPTIGRGAPVILRGIVVGKVKEKTFDAQNRPVLEAVIRREYARLLSRNARFWRVPATSVQAGPGVLNVDVAGVEALWQGGVAFDVFGAPGEPVQEGADFELFANEAIARADSPAIHITFENGQGLLAGRTQLRYLGVPVGVVGEVKTSKGKVVVSARLDAGHENLRRKGSLFSVIRPSVSLEGVSGLEALVSGVYIECVPSADGPLEDQFTGVSLAREEAVEAEETSFEVLVETDSSTINPNAPVQYRGVRVGKIVRKEIAPDGKTVRLVAGIERPYAALLRENTKFWDVSGIRASLGFFAIKVRTGSLESLTLGGIEFATPEGRAMGERVKPGHVFQLNTSPRKEWLRWSPSIPVTGDNR